MYIVSPARTPAASSKVASAFVSIRLGIGTTKNKDGRLVYVPAEGWGFRSSSSQSSFTRCAADRWSKRRTRRGPLAVGSVASRRG